MAGARRPQAKPGKPQQAITFIDLGSGTIKGRAFKLAERRHAKGRPGLFKAVDTEKAGYKPPLNLELVQKDAVKYLESLKPKSAKIINADFLILYVAEQKKLANMLKQIKRVLVDNGRLYLTVPKIQLRATEEALKKSGFRASSRPVKIKESTKTAQTFGFYWLRYLHGITSFWRLKPIRVVARKAPERS